MKRTVIFISLLVTGLSFCFADFNSFNIPDSTEIRLSVAESWFYDDVSDLREKRAELRKNKIGQNFQIRMEETESSFAVIVAPQMKLDVDLYTEHGVVQQTLDQYPGDACGSWELIRNIRTGKPERIRVYFSNNNEMYIQFSPDYESTNGNKTLADFVICGLYASRAVPLGIPFETLYTASFQDILRITGNSLPWKYADTQKGQFSSKMQMIGVLRKNQGRIVYLENSCYDENGKLIYISDGNPREIELDENTKDKILVDQFGYLKWIVDGLVEPVAGSKLYRNPLMVKTQEFNPVGLKGVRENTEDLSFSLDWCRNLAAAAVSIRTHRNYLWSEAGADVTIEPFSAEVTNQGITQTAGYLNNSGYQIEKLKPLLYVLASTEPTYCYLAAVKRPVKDGKNPEFFKFDQCAVIFPVYNENGQFLCTVFENGKELSLKDFTTKYKGCFVHLSRVLTESRFFPE